MYGTTYCTTEFMTAIIHPDVCQINFTVFQFLFFIFGLQDKVVLPLPAIEVLADAVNASDRRLAVIHVLESSVVSWMKQVKV